MTWFKVDDSFAFHPKVVNLPSAAGWLWVRAGAWCAQNLTDGHLPAGMLGALGGTDDDAHALVDVGLWKPSESGYVFHDWFEYQPSRQQVEQERRATKERQKKWREQKAAEKAAREAMQTRNGVTNGVTDGVSNGSGHGVTNDAPTRPDPTLNNTSSDADERADVEALCTRLADRIEGNGANRPTITKQWRTEARRMLDLDGRELNRALRLIDWCQADPFWRSNILSMPTFRTKYDQLRLKATAEWEQRKGSGVSPDGDVDPELVLGPDSWTIPDPPEGVEPGTPDYTRWARQMRDEHKAERVAQALERLERRAG